MYYFIFTDMEEVDKIFIIVMYYTNLFKIIHLWFLMIIKKSH